MDEIIIYAGIGAVGGLCRTLDWVLNSKVQKIDKMSVVKVARNLLFGAIGGTLLGVNYLTAFAAGAFFELSAVSIVWDGMVKKLGGTE